MNSPLSKLTGFLGNEVTKLLCEEPYKSWKYEISLAEESELVGAGYTFRSNGLALNCDENNKVTSIFLFFEKYGGFLENEPILGIRRDQVQKIFGKAQRSGNAISDPVLGKCGPWDLYVFQDSAINLTYAYHRDQVEMITLMTLAVVPR